MKYLAAVLTAASVMFAVDTVSAAGDAIKGKKVYNKCRACHALVAGKRKIGPSLSKIFGRMAGTEKYNYSKAMKKAGKKGLVWNEETLKKYLTSPRKFVPGNRMPFVGLKKAVDRDNLMAYLKKATK
ncbi:MAG: cytochrome c family protein [Rhodospirillaceae bacterium]|nr:cytochrome c family protein [Rhodospirillaceae bacterium]|tara:strand:+ start:323 stop:703 length:381 start_codon:yes stop_codon:yes gene_type:complete